MGKTNLMVNHKQDQNGNCVNAQTHFPNGGCCRDCDESMVIKNAIYKLGGEAESILEKIIQSEEYMKQRFRLVQDQVKDFVQEACDGVLHEDEQWWTSNSGGSDVPDNAFEFTASAHCDENLQPDIWSATYDTIQNAAEFSQNMQGECHEADSIAEEITESLSTDTEGMNAAKWIHTNDPKMRQKICGKVVQLMDMYVMGVRDGIKYSCEARDDDDNVAND